MVLRMPQQRCEGLACNFQELDYTTGQVEVTWNRRLPDGSGQEVQLFLCDSCADVGLDALLAASPEPKRSRFRETPPPDPWPPEA